MDQNIISVHTPDELDRILAADRRRLQRVMLALESMEPVERERWERRINGYYRTCGCGSAAVALLIALVAGAALLVANYDLLATHPFTVIGLSVLTLLAALALGKAAGLWVARLRLRSTVSSLRRRLAPLS